MGVRFGQIHERADDFIDSIYKNPLLTDFCSLTTKIHFIAVKTCWKLPKEFNVGDIVCEWELKSVYPKTESFWEDVKKVNMLGGEIKEEELPSVQSEEELIATCFAYILSIPDWNDRDDFFIYPFVQEVIQRVQQGKGETLETLRTSLTEKGIDIPSREIDQVHIVRRKNEILRLLALNSELISSENRWILEVTEHIVRSYWEVMHKYVLQRMIKNCISQILSSLPAWDLSLKDSHVLHGNVTIEAQYVVLEDVEKNNHRVLMLVSKF